MFAIFGATILHGRAGPQGATPDEGRCAPGADTRRAAVSRISFILFIFLILAVGAGAMFLATWDIPAPLQRIEQELPNDRFPP